MVLPTGECRWQHGEVVETLIQQHRKRINGELSDKNRVTDQLLDIRLAATDQPEIVEIVDRLLVERPGLTTVTNKWWTEALDELELAVQAVPARF